MRIIIWNIRQIQDPEPENKKKTYKKKHRLEIRKIETLEPGNKEKSIILSLLSLEIRQFKDPETGNTEI